MTFWRKLRTLKLILRTTLDLLRGEDEGVSLALLHQDGRMVHLLPGRLESGSWQEDDDGE